MRPTAMASEARLLEGLLRADFRAFLHKSLTQKTTIARVA
jgi:hypothetical protein